VDFEIRTVAEDEWDVLLRTLGVAFGEEIDAREAELARKVNEFDRTVAAFENGRIVGAGSIASLELTVPGTLAPVAGVTSIGVLPTHRRRGVMSSVLRKQFEDVHEGDEVIACLYASEGAIYQRFGYGMGVPMGHFSIDKRRSAYARALQPRGEIHMLDRNEAMGVVKDVYERGRPRWPGLLSRPGSWWEFRLYPHAHGDGGWSQWFFAAHQAEELDGYVIYRIRQDWSHESPNLELEIEELMALTEDAYAALWRFCLDTDLVARITGWKRPADDPILHMLAEPRSLGFHVRDGLWVRPVDVDGALSARRYATEGRVVFEVHDSNCPWNEGRFELEGGPDGASCRRTDAEPDLIVDAADLGATFMGGVAFQTLAAASRVVEVSPGAIRRADAMFTWQPGPWCAHII
jgi:predicted acetyltransferase